MRHIDLSKLKDWIAEYPELQNWDAKEQAHVEALRGLDKKGRADYFRTHSDWNLWIPIFYRLMEGKCWYTESPPNSNHWAIEHFRPKNRANISEDVCLKEGYWWLAYRVDNFRLAGSIVNLCRQDIFSEEDEVLGKGNYFPLYLEKCKHCEPEQNHEEEISLLLDPVVLRDTTLITFDADGSVVCTKKEGTFEYEKVKCSIKFLALDHGHIKTERKKVWDACVNHILRGEKFHKYEITAQTEHTLDQIYDDLKNLASYKAVYSSTAKACIKFHYKLYPERFHWLEDVMESI
jgi:hypothetical protein